MANRRTYLDHLASAPLAPEALQAMHEAWETLGNPASAHAEGRRALDLLDRARAAVAETLNVRPREVRFTGSGTLAAQIALRGIAHARRDVSERVVLSAVEHPAVAEAAESLEGEGFEVVRVAPTAGGGVGVDDFLGAVGVQSGVAALMLANHETGILMPVAEVGDELRRRGVPFLCDASLGPGRVGCTPADTNAVATVLSAHKFGGPRGTGLLIAGRRTPMLPLWNGGLQEDRFHPGTASIAGAVGCAAALRRAVEETEGRARRYAQLLGVFLEGIESARPWSRIGTGHPTLPGVATLEWPDVEGESAMINLDLEGVAVSTGSQCALGGADPSPSLLAMGIDGRRAQRTLRVAFGEGVEAGDAARVAHVVSDVVSRLRCLGRGFGSPTKSAPTA